MPLEPSGRTYSALLGVLAEQASVEEARLPLRFEPEPRVELFAKPLVAVGARLPEAENGLGVHGEAVSRFVIGVQSDRSLAP